MGRGHAHAVPAARPRDRPDIGPLRPPSRLRGPVRPVYRGTVARDGHHAAPGPRAARAHRRRRRTPSPRCCVRASAADLGEAEVTVDGRARRVGGRGARRTTRGWSRTPAAALVGYALVSGGDVQVAVHPEAEGAGIGTELRQAAEEARASTGNPRGETVRSHRQHRRARPPARGGMVARAPLLPHADRPQARARPARRPRRGRSTPTATPRRCGTSCRAPTPDVEGHLPQSLESWRATGDRRSRAGIPRCGSSRTTPRASSARRSARRSRAHRRDQRARRRASRARARPRAHAAARAARRVPRQAAVARRGRRPRPDRGGGARCSSRSGWPPARQTERWEKILAV